MQRDITRALSLSSSSLSRCCCFFLSRVLPFLCPNQRRVQSNSSRNMRTVQYHGQHQDGLPCTVNFALSSSASFTTPCCSLSRLFSCVVFFLSCLILSRCCLSRVLPSCTPISVVSSQTPAGICERFKITNSNKIPCTVKFALSPASGPGDSSLLAPPPEKPKGKKGRGASHGGGEGDHAPGKVGGTFFVLSFFFLQNLALSCGTFVLLFFFVFFVKIF